MKLDELRKRLRARELEQEADDTAKPTLENLRFEADVFKVRIDDEHALPIGQSVSVTTYEELLLLCRDCDKGLDGEGDDRTWLLCRECIEKRELMRWAIVELCTCKTCHAPFRPKEDETRCPRCEAKP